MYSVTSITKESRSKEILVVIANSELLIVSARSVRFARSAHLARSVHLAVLALLSNHVNLTNHVILAIHLSQKFRVILVILLILTIQTIQTILDISDLLESRVVQNYHMLSLVQLNQLLLTCSLIQLSLMIQNSLEFSVNLIVLEYLMLLVIQTILSISKVSLLIVMNDRSAFHAVLECSKEQAAIELSK